MTQEVNSSGPTGPAGSDDAAGRGTQPRKRLSWSSFLTLGLPPILFAGISTGLIYVLRENVSGGRKILVPQPHTIFTDAIGDADTRSELLEGLVNTSKVAFTGLAIAIALGLLFAVLMSQARLMEDAFFPWAVVIQTVPILALVPLIGVWFGFGFKSRVIVAVLISLFPIITNALFGLKSVDDDLHDLFSLHGASRFTRLWKLQFPASMPATFTGFRIAAGLSVIGAIVGEFFFGRGETGLGNLVNKYRGLVQIEELYATIILSSLLGIVVFFAFGRLSRLVVGSWYDSSGNEG
jgi:NitT/TauT family transport system permease protein